MNGLRPRRVHHASHRRRPVLDRRGVELPVPASPMERQNAPRPCLTSSSGCWALPLPKAPRPGPAGRHDPPHSSAIQPFPRWNCRELFDNRCCDYRKKPSLPAATRPYTFGLMSHLSAQKPLTVEDDTVGSLVNDAEPADRMRLWLQPGDGPRPTSRHLRWLHVSTNDGEWSTCTVLTVGSGIAAAYVFHRKAAQPSLPRSGSDQSW